MDHAEVLKNLTSAMKTCVENRERAEAVMQSKLSMLNAVLVGDLAGREAEVEKARQECLDAMSAVLDVIIDAHKRIEAIKPY